MYSFVKFCCSIYFYFNSANLVCGGIDISKFFLESPLDFEILRVDYFCTKTYVVGTHQKCIIEALLMSTHNIFFIEN